MQSMILPKHVGTFNFLGSPKHLVGPPDSRRFFNLGTRIATTDLDVDFGSRTLVALFLSFLLSHEYRPYSTTSSSAAAFYKSGTTAVRTQNQSHRSSRTYSNTSLFQ